jgi:hypothetical protein
MFPGQFKLALCKWKDDGREELRHDQQAAGQEGASQ